MIRAIDPGPTLSAYADWDGEKIHNCGIFQNDVHIYDLDEPLPAKKIYIEMVTSYGMPVGKDVFETCLWIGRFLCMYESAGFDCELVYRKDVKMHLCASTRAKDSNIITAIVDRFDPNREYGQYGKGTKKNPGMFYGFNKDMWQAFALALYAKDKIEEK